MGVFKGLCMMLFVSESFHALNEPMTARAQQGLRFSMLSLLNVS